jgi:hypothetical protein
MFETFFAIFTNLSNLQWI